jgi:replication factor C subunit 2/4
MKLFNSNTKQLDIINIKIPWIEKYRPNTLDELLVEPFIKEKINKILLTQSIPNMIITGEPSTGKTSTILFLAKEMYKDHYTDNVLELNASDDRGLSIINNTIYPFCKKKTLGLLDLDNKYPRHKLIILDEADSITTKAQNLLSNLISDFRKNSRIIFICNDCTQIIESIQSKCMIIKYPKLNYSNLRYKVEYICKHENIKYNNDNDIDTLLFVSDYDIRQIINNLECIYYSFGVLNENTINKLIDKPKPYYIHQLLNYCYQSDYVNTINLIKMLYNKGYTPNDILLTFMKYLFEYNFINEIYAFTNRLNEDHKLHIYELLSSSYTIINGGTDTLLQLYGCISNIYIYIQNLLK